MKTWDEMSGDEKALHTQEIIEVHWRTTERLDIIEGLRVMADNVLKPSDYRDGYVQAMNDIRDDALPNASRFIKGENE